MIVKCIRNDSKSLPFYVNEEYEAEHQGGVFKIFDKEGSSILAPLKGHYAEFIEVQ